jgi:hypothetical protein
MANKAEVLKEIDKQIKDIKYRHEEWLDGGITTQQFEEQFEIIYMNILDLTEVIK